jgi:type IV secretory pathway VirB10-like protein
MKRCPKCEFIYEDDQSLCDMDGVLLVLDSRTLPHIHALQTVETKTPPRRNRAVPALATLILALVLGLVYYVSTQRKTNTETPPPASTASTTNPLPEVNPTPEAQPSAAQLSEEPKPEPPKAATTAAAAPVKKVAAKLTPPPTKARVEEKKDDSKVGNFLKKTGRILKKPFKF